MIKKYMTKREQISRAPPNPSGPDEAGPSEGEMEALMTLFDDFGRIKLSLHDIGPRWSSRMQMQLQEAGLNAAAGPEQIGLLLQFHRTYRILGGPDKVGPGVSMSEISERLGISLSSATRVIDQLVQLGLLTRRPDSRDRRIVLASATERGAAVYHLFDAAFKQHLGSLIGQFSPDERRQMLHLGQRLFEVWSASVQSDAK